VLDALPRRSGAGPSATAVVVQYLGFQDAPGRREYGIRVRRGDQDRQYTLWIAQASFAQRHALLQDGPDICYQKLLRALADPELPAADCIAVTDGDLADYRETHTRAPRRGFSHSRPQDEAKPAAAALPGEHDEPA
jgi:hypothetical protein